MHKKIYITEQQLDELIDSDLMLSTSTVPEYGEAAGEVSTTEPLGPDSTDFGDPMTSDDKAKDMPPGVFQRMTSRGNYGGISV